MTMSETLGKLSWSRVQAFLAAEPYPPRRAQAVKKEAGAAVQNGSAAKTGVTEQSLSRTSTGADDVAPLETGAQPPLQLTDRPPIGEKRPTGSSRGEREPEREPELVSESSPSSPIFDIPKATLILPKILTSPEEHDPDWEILSDRASVSSAGNAVFVPRAGSVRSITSNSSHTPSLSLPYKISRSPSSSTIDTQEVERLGPSGKGVLGVDYVEHIVLPSDTLQGICIAYKVKASNLRRANHFTGQSLHSAPKKLLIPLSKQALRAGFIRVQDTDSKEYKMQYMHAEHPDLTVTEIKAYLELSDWDLKDAMQSAKEDTEWEKEVDGSCEGALKPGQISIKVDQRSTNSYNIRLKGTGHRATAKPGKAGTTTEGAKHRFSKKSVVVHAKPPAIATNSIVAQDALKASSEHQSFGVELRDFSRT